MVGSHLTVQRTEISKMRRKLFAALVAITVTLSLSLPASAQWGNAPVPQVTRIIALTNQSADDIAQALGGTTTPGFANLPDGISQFRSAVGNKLVVTGEEKSVARIEEAAKALDVPSPLVHSVRVRTCLKVTLTTADAPARVTDDYTENVGAEGITFYSSLSGNEQIKATVDKVERPIFRPIDRHTQLLPKILPDGRISLQGRGGFTYQLPQPSADSFNRDYDIAISAKPGEPTIVASGEVNLGKSRAQFTVSVIATVEPGMVPQPDARAYTQAYGSYNNGRYSGYGSMDRGNYGGYGGSSYGGAANAPSSQTPPTSKDNKKTEPAKPTPNASKT